MCLEKTSWRSRVPFPARYLGMQLDRSRLHMMSLVRGK